MFPSLPLDAWADTKVTLHRFAQVVGKVRLAVSVRRNHWWNVPFHLTGRGITTRPMGNDPIFTIDFDFVAHQLLVCSITGQAASFPLAGQSVASFYQHMTQALTTLGVGRGTGVLRKRLPGRCSARRLGRRAPKQPRRSDRPRSLTPHPAPGTRHIEVDHGRVTDR